MYASNYFEEKIINLMRGQSITAPASVYLALFLSNPGDTGSGGTEVSYTGYVRQAITFSAPAAQSGVANGMVLANQNVVTFPESTSSGSFTVQYVAVFDSLTGGNMYLYGQLDSPLVIQSGVSPVFRAGSIQWIWSGSLSTYYKTATMNVLRGTQCSGFSPYLAYFDSNPSSGGAEIQADDYTRTAVTMSEPIQQTSGSGAALSQNTALAMTPNAASNWGNVSYVGIMDAQTAGNAFAVISLGATYTANTGVSIGFKAGDLKFSIN